MSKKLLIKKPRVIEVDDKKVTVSKFEKHLVDDTKDFSTQFGMIKKKRIKKRKHKSWKRRI